MSAEVYECYVILQFTMSYNLYNNNKTHFSVSIRKLNFFIPPPPADNYRRGKNTVARPCARARDETPGIFIFIILILLFSFFYFIFFLHCCSTI